MERGFLEFMLLQCRETEAAVVIDLDEIAACRRRIALIESEQAKAAPIIRFGEGGARIRGTMQAQAGQSAPGFIASTVGIERAQR